VFDVAWSCSCIPVDWAPFVTDRVRTPAPVTENGAPGGSENWPVAVNAIPETANSLYSSASRHQQPAENHKIRRAKR
jgi:hypothetical protein